MYIYIYIQNPLSEWNEPHEPSSKLVGPRYSMISACYFHCQRNVASIAGLHPSDFGCERPRVFGHVAPSQDQSSYLQNRGV